MVVTYIGSLVQSCCREGRTLQTNIICMCGVCCVSRSHWVCPCSWRVCFPSLHCSGPRLLCRGTVGPGLHALPRSKPLSFRFSGTPKGADSVGPTFCGLPRPEQLRRPGAWWAHTPQVQCLIASPSQLLGFWVHSRSAISGVLCVSSGELISGCGPPGGCQPSRILGRLG